MNKLVIITGMPHSGKSTLLKELQRNLPVAGFMFDNFHNIDNMYKKFPRLAPAGIDLVNRACQIIFGSVYYTFLDIVVEGVDFMSKEVLDIFVDKADNLNVDYKIFRLVINHDKWINQVPEKFPMRKNRKFYENWEKFPKDERLIEISNSKSIEDFLRRDNE